MDLRRQVKFETTPVTVGLDILATILALLPAGWTYYFWSRLPERIPTHFGAGGQADAWGDRSMVWLLPAVSVFLLLLLLTLLRFARFYNVPVKLTPENVHRQLHLARWLVYATMIWVLILLAWISWGQIQVALGNASLLGKGFSYGILGAELIVLGWYFSASFRAR